jgi:hypothetical protein
MGANLQVLRDFEIDQLLGIIHIHYADAGFMGNAAAAAPTPAPRQQVTPQPQRQPVPTRPGLFRR